jgi:hypothetical protein
MDPDPDPNAESSINNKKNNKNLDSADPGPDQQQNVMDPER